MLYTLIIYFFRNFMSTNQFSYDTIQYSINLSDNQCQVIKKIINTQERQQTLQKLRFNLRSVKSCLTNLLNNF